MVFNNLLLHFRPIQVPRKSLAFNHTFGLGGMSLVLVLMLMATGVLLMFAYEPVPGAGYESVARLQRDVLFGKFVRGVHYWSANILVVVMTLHLLRVYFTSAFLEPRQFNWIIGITLLLCVLGSNFTGYLLPWDQLSYWAITISTGMLSYVPIVGDWLRELMLGGSEVGQETVLNFYTLHTTILPAAIFALMAFHFWRVRKVGGVVVPSEPEGKPDERPSKVLALPNLLYREFVVALVLVAIVFVVAALFTAPLGEIANPGMSPNPAKPPWYFVGFQELLLHFHPSFAVLILPLMAALALLALPYLTYDGDTSGVWFVSRRGMRFACIAVTATVAGTAALVLLDEYLVDLGTMLHWLPNAVSTGLIPTILLLASAWIVGQWLSKRLGASRAEVVQTLFVIMVAAFGTLTAIGFWFRGPGMVLSW